MPGLAAARHDSAPCRLLSLQGLPAPGASMTAVNKYFNSDCRSYHLPPAVQCLKAESSTSIFNGPAAGGMETGVMLDVCWCSPICTALRLMPLNSFCLSLDEEAVLQLPMQPLPFCRRAKHEVWFIPGWPSKHSEPRNFLQCGFADGIAMHLMNCHIRREDMRLVSSQALDCKFLQMSLRRRQGT